MTLSLVASLLASLWHAEADADPLVRAESTLQVARQVPDYDGRPSEPPTLGQSLVWVPRVLLFPAAVVSEFGIRRPLVATVAWSESHYVPQHIHRTLTWNDDKIGVRPTLAADLGLRPMTGVAFFAHELVHPAHDVKAAVSFAVDGLRDVHARNQLKVFRGGSARLSLRAGYLRQPRSPFHGLGADTRNDERRRYVARARTVALGFEGSLGGLSRVEVELGYRGMSFAPGKSDDEDAEEVGLDGPLPAGFEAYDVIAPQARIVMDSRSASIQESASGVRLSADVGIGVALQTKSSFVPWGAEAAAFWDVSNVHHVLAVEFVARFVENTGTGHLPVAEMPMLGGPEFMRGFLAGRFRGQSVVSATLQWRYPVAGFIDSELFAGVGNAFDARLRDFDVNALFANYGLALRTSLKRDTSVAVTLAFGSDRFDDANFETFDTFRLAFGVNQGF